MPAMPMPDFAVPYAAPRQPNIILSIVLAMGGVIDTQDCKLTADAIPAWCNTNQ
jgi:hypothetical protein